MDNNDESNDRENCGHWFMGNSVGLCTFTLSQALQKSRDTQNQSNRQYIIKPEI